MLTSRSRWIERACPWVMGVTIAVALWVSLPPTTLVVNDDFGYLRSIAATLRHGRPWTDDWLAPWAASLSLLSALLFKVTASFRVSTYGLQAVCTGVIVALYINLLCSRGLSWAPAALWSLVFVSFPTLLWKLSEFGAVPLYLACLLAALWSAERGKWALFGLFWLVAVSSRQSALLWLALPAGMLLETTGGLRNLARTIGKIMGIGLAGGLVYWLVQKGMNRTHAQTVLASGILGRSHTSVFFRNSAVAMALFLACAGLGSLAFIGTTAPQPAATPSWQRRLVRLASVLAVAALWMLDARGWIRFEHPLFFGGKAGLYLTGLGILSVAGWTLADPSIRFRYLAPAVALAALLGSRSDLWDYYLVDIAVFGLLGIAPAPKIENASRARPARLLIGSTAVFLLWFQSSFVVARKVDLDRAFGVISLCERALRAGQIQPSDLRGVPFGFTGWHLYPYFVANDGAASAFLSEFYSYYVRHDALRLEVGPLETPQPTTANGGLREDEDLLASDVFPFGWGTKARYCLIKRKAPKKPRIEIDSARYTFEPFPLNDSEWRQALSLRGRRGVW